MDLNGSSSVSAGIRCEAKYVCTFILHPYRDILQKRSFKWHWKSNGLFFLISFGDSVKIALRQTL